MRSLSFIAAAALLFSSSTSYIVSATSIARHSDSELRKYYSRSHSLGEDYQFDNKEWHSVNASDLPYKYKDSSLTKRNSKVASAGSDKNVGGSIAHIINGIWNGLKGIGSNQEVKITWYTGHDLLNPSCWPKTDWAPSDESFACALTLQGWDAQPKCFKFLELCNGPKKCIFVRKVDTCAGCAPGSKHVDLTKGAFSQLASIDEGVLNVQMRASTDPQNWFVDLWGPEH